MRQFLILVFSFLTMSVFAQAVKEMEPVLGRLVDVSPEGEIAFIKQMEQCEGIWKKVNSQKDYDNLSPEEKKIFDNCDDSQDRKSTRLNSSH